MTNNIITKESKTLGEKYYYIKHKSGLDIYVFPKALSTSYALFATKYGSIDNKFRLCGESEYTVVPDGIAHFLEHKLFESADGVDAFERYAETGASANAYTSFDKTAYLFSATERFYDSLEILLDFVTHPYFTPETVAKEQGIIGQELRMYEDIPAMVMEMGLLESLYEKHNIRIDIGGTVESIAEITADILYKCYNTFYNLHNMALCVCGEVDVEKTLAVADKILKEAPAQKIESLQAEEKPCVFRKKFSRNMQVARPQFEIGIKDTAIPESGEGRMKKSAELSVLLEMLFGKSGEFYNRLYEQGKLSKSFDYDFEMTKSFSFAVLSGEADDPDEIFDKFREYMEKTLSEGLSRESFERSLRVVYADEIKSFDSTDEIANDFLGFAFDDGDILDYVEYVGKVTFEDVSRLAEEMFSEEKYALSVIYPLESEKSEE